jgi:hypothetical protein
VLRRRPFEHDAVVIRWDFDKLRKFQASRLDSLNGLTRRHSQFSSRSARLAQYRGQAPASPSLRSGPRRCEYVLLIETRVT